MRHAKKSNVAGAAFPTSPIGGVARVRAASCPMQQGEESRAQVSDLANAKYPLAARILRVRRDNLLATISTLEAYSANNA